MNNLGLMDLQVDEPPCTRCAMIDHCRVRRLACDQFVLYVERQTAPKHIKEATVVKRNPTQQSFERIYGSNYVKINGSATQDVDTGADGVKTIRRKEGNGSQGPGRATVLAVEADPHSPGDGRALPEAERRSHDPQGVGPEWDAGLLPAI